MAFASPRYYHGCEAQKPEVDVRVLVQILRSKRNRRSTVDGSLNISVQCLFGSHISVKGSTLEASLKYSQARCSPSLSFIHTKYIASVGTSAAAKLHIAIWTCSDSSWPAASLWYPASRIGETTRSEQDIDRVRPRNWIELCCTMRSDFGIVA